MICDKRRSLYLTRTRQFMQRLTEKVLSEAAANNLFGINRPEDPARDCPTRHGTYSGTVNKIRIAVFEPELYHLSLDLFVLFHLYEALPENSTRAVRILRALSKVVETFADDTDNATACRELLRPLLQKKANASAITATAIGHAHIDTGWLWPVRETICNLSWDMARFEVAAHKYADLSDHGYGVALLNDCKYGYKVLENVLDLNLLRAHTNPDPDADEGHRAFTYSLLPHTGALIDSDVQEQAIQLNQPPAIFTGRALGEAAAPLIVEGDGVALEVLKKAEKEDCLVVRLVERLGRETTATVSLSHADDSLVGERPSRVGAPCRTR